MLHKSLSGRASYEFDEKSSLSLSSSLESIPPTDIMKMYTTSSITPSISQNSSSSILTK